MFNQVKQRLLDHFQQEVLNKQAVSARWVAKRLGNAVRNREDLTPRRLAQTNSLLNRWITGAQRRSFRALKTDKTNYPGRGKAIALLNKHIGDEMVKTPGEGTPRLVFNILDDPIFSRSKPHYNFSTKKIQPGQSWPLALHEYGHWMDDVVARNNVGGIYGLEILANRNALRARDKLEQLNVPVSSRRELFDAYKKTLETYKLEELRQGLIPSWTSFTPIKRPNASSIVRLGSYSKDAPRFVRGLQDRVNDRFMTTSGLTEEGISERRKFHDIMLLGKDYYNNRRPL